MTERLDQISAGRARALDADLGSAIDEAMLSLVVASLAIILLSLLWTAWIIRSAVQRPLAATLRQVEAIGRGETASAPADGRSDEWGQIQAALARMSAELAQALRAAQSASAAKSQFLAVMSHELRTPLNGIIGFTEVLANQYFGELNPRQLDYCRDIISASHRLLTIINDILDLASIEAGRLVLERAPVDARAVLDGTVQVMADLARDARMTLRVSSGEGLPPLDADERRLKQALCNLVSNAIKFAPPGGTVILSARQDPDGMAALAVSDSGPGIAPEDQDRVFRAFERGGPPGQPGQGAGLGLSLVRRIVELHGGEVRLESHAGAGTTVICRIPVATDAARG